MMNDPSLLINYAMLARKNFTSPPIFQVLNKCASKNKRLIKINCHSDTNNEHQILSNVMQTPNSLNDY